MKTPTPIISALAFAFALGLAFGFATTSAQAESKPNIVLIFVDDMGYGDLGCYGNTRNKTPNIDRLAAEGQRWTSFYSSGATCVPSRRGLMTGRHPSLMGNADLVGARDKLMAAMLRGHGYATAILGKWHLAGYPKDFTTSLMHPCECGFDYHYGTPGSNDVPAPKGKVQNREVFDTCDKLTFQVPLIRGREVVERDQPLAQQTVFLLPEVVGAACDQHILDRIAAYNEEEVLPGLESKIIVDEQSQGILPLLNLDAQRGEQP